jgi:hypothetical protein
MHRQTPAGGRGRSPRAPQLLAAPAEAPPDPALTAGPRRRPPPPAPQLKLVVGFPPDYLLPLQEANLTKALLNLRNMDFFGLTDRWGRAAVGPPLSLESRVEGGVGGRGWGGSGPPRACFRTS